MERKTIKCPSCGSDFHIPTYKRRTQYANLIKFDASGYPSCEKHGAMNCVNKERSLWRCSACGVGVSFEDVNVFDEWLRIQKDRVRLGIIRRGL